MYVESVHIESFRRFGQPGVDLDLRRPAIDGAWRRYLVLGDNGSGKTTVLQAIALTLSLAQGKTKTIDDFRWTGWTPERLLRGGDPLVDIVVHFSPEEIEATQAVARRWWDRTRPSERAGFVEPGDAPDVTFSLRGTAVRAPTPAQLYQLRGRGYASALMRSDPESRHLLHLLPGVFWYDQYRNIALPGGREEEGAPPTFRVGAERLSEALLTWHQRRPDLIQDLEQLYQATFPEYRFAGVEDQWGNAPTPIGGVFLLGDGTRTWTLPEMSAGEQAVFPILFEFVRQQIHRSVVLIDEIDLNLHPPLAQTLVALLPRLGTANQFVFTTHAEAVSSVLGQGAIARLPGGRLCL